MRVDTCNLLADFIAKLSINCMSTIVLIYHEPYAYMCIKYCKIYNGTCELTGWRLDVADFPSYVVR